MSDDQANDRRTITWLSCAIWSPSKNQGAAASMCDTPQARHSKV